MAIPTIEKRQEYVSYAEHCVKLARQTNDPESRSILRDGRGMAKAGGRGRPLVNDAPSFYGAVDEYFITTVPKSPAASNQLDFF